MSSDKYPSIFSLQMETIVFIILQIFFATRAILKIGEYSWKFSSFGWGIYNHVTPLDQSREQNNLMDYKLRYSYTRSHEVFRPIARERKYLMDYKNSCFSAISI